MALTKLENEVIEGGSTIMEKSYIVTFFTDDEMVGRMVTDNPAKVMEDQVGNFTSFLVRRMITDNPAKVMEDQVGKIQQTEFTENFRSRIEEK